MSSRCAPIFVTLVLLTGGARAYAQEAPPPPTDAPAPAPAAPLPPLWSTHPPRSPSAGWARVAGAIGLVDAGFVAALTVGIVFLNEDRNLDGTSRNAEQARLLGLAATTLVAAGGPVVAIGASSARRYPGVGGLVALRVASWIGYGLTLLEAITITIVSFNEPIPSWLITSVGALGTLSMAGFAIDAFASAAQVDRLPRTARHPQWDPWAGSHTLPRSGSGEQSSPLPTRSGPLPLALVQPRILGLRRADGAIVPGLGVGGSF